MPWQDHVGEQKRTGPTAVDAERIEAFVAGIAEKNPRHADPSHASHCAPPLVVAASIIPGTGAMLAEVDTGANLMRIVHGGIDIHLKRVLKAGDELTCVATFKGVESKGSGDLITFDFDLLDGSGASVCDGETRYFVRGTKKGAGGPKPEKADPGPPTHVVTETVQPGQSKLYAKGSGDSFPIHTDVGFAKSVGLPDIILHGMCTLAFSVRHVVDAVAGGDSSRLRHVGVRFSKMVFHNDELTTRIWVDGERVAFRTTNQKGETVLDEGTATVVS